MVGWIFCRTEFSRISRLFSHITYILVHYVQYDVQYDYSYLLLGGSIGGGVCAGIGGAVRGAGGGVPWRPVRPTAILNTKAKTTA